MPTVEQSRHFGLLLKRHRLAAGLSQDELAERAGLSRRGISDLERGTRRTPHPVSVSQLEAAIKELVNAYYRCDLPKV
jgi:transcriptional regulator with XRE-family HTH domain